MPRYAKANCTIEDLKKIIDSFNGVYYIVKDSYIQKIKKDLLKIQVEFENVDLISEYDTPGAEELEPYEMINGIPVVWCAGGGDWELPIVFCMYISNTGGLRAYIPSNGNAYDHTKKQAYEADDFETDEELDAVYLFDVHKLRDDVKNRLKIKR